MSKAVRDSHERVIRERDEARAEVERLRAVMRPACDGCGKAGRCSGDTCSECGGMVLSETALGLARALAEVERLRPVVEAAQSVDWTVYLALGALAPVRDMDGARTAARVTAASAQLHALIDALEES
ncbi:MAG TPA: hypothetical protein VM366_15990 [Anaerolineae bacterium]|nr:hypothetical protein [Anaerolineae bacterium]